MSGCRRGGVPTERHDLTVCDRDEGQASGQCQAHAGDAQERRHQGQQ